MTPARDDAAGLPLEQQAQAVLADRLQQFRALTPPALLGQSLAGGLLVAVLWRQQPADRLLAWYAALLALVALRLLTWWWLARPQPRPPPQARLWTHRVQAGLTGVAWGLAAVWLFPAGDLQAQTFLGFVLAGMAAGSLTLFAFDLVTALGFAAAALLPLAFRLLAGGDPAGMAMAAMVGLFVGYLALVGLRSQRAYRELVVARAADAARAQALQASQARLKELSDQLARKSQALEITLGSMDQGILSLGPDGRTQFFNQRLTELADLPAELLARGPTLAEIAQYQHAQGHYGDGLDHVIDEPARQTLARWLAGERPQFPPSYLRRMPDGRTLEVKSRYLSDGGLVRTFTDVTASLQAQAQTRKLALVAAHTRDGVVVADAGRRVEWVNDGFTDITGLTLGQVRGRLLREVLQGPAFAPEVLARQAEELARHGHTRDALALVRADGQTRWVEAEIFVVADDLGGPLQYVTIGRDITERRRADAELRRARDEAERASRAKSEFLSAMSHELRTPMNAILGFARLLQADRAQPLTERQRGRVQQILTAGEHLLGLINDVLDLARVEAGKQASTLEPVAVQPLLDECLSLMRPAADARQLQMRDDGSAAGVWVRADRLRLRQVLLNLLSNAVKYNRAGGAVRVGSRPADSGFRLCISDDGPGLDAEQQKRLFTPFERLGADRGPIEGAGVGLALSRWLLELMHGRIGVDSEAGAGSTFWIELPLAEAPAQATGSAPSVTPTPVAEEPTGGVRTVLYVEDNPVNAMLVQDMLEGEPGIRLRVATRPEEGLALAAAEPPCLVLLDIQLPGMDGYEVLRRLRAMPGLRHTPVCALSANAMREDLARARAAGFDDYLTKPIDVDTLLAVVRGAARR
jgi:PAS domain S-box-containing protein